MSPGLLLCILATRMLILARFLASLRLHPPFLPFPSPSSLTPAAILTSRIHSLTTHLISQPRDIHNRRPLRSLIHQRAKVLKYLRTVNVLRYEECLSKIGVQGRAVEGEVVVTKQGLRELIRSV